MTMLKYEVAIISKQQTTFIVEAASEDAAEEIAIEKFQNGDKGDLPGYDYESIENIVTRKLEQVVISNAVEFNEVDCSGVFDGFQVTSDADPGL